MSIRMTSELVNDTPEESRAFLKRDIVSAEEEVQISGRAA